MEYIYAGLLLHNAKQPINEDNLKKVLTASGVKVDAARVKALVAALNEVNIDEVIKAAAVPVAAAPAATAAPAAPAAEAKKEAKEEKKAEASEEETAEGLGSLFG
ncbi:MAG: 50S ribosomal protein P1 [Candidatus Verstraetearchaeota archaeon]|nr:50S ribosomal protein P1 [Candidatus Verstraetearchaeota archaeon]